MSRVFLAIDCLSKLPKKPATNLILSDYQTSTRGFVADTTSKDNLDNSVNYLPIRKNIMRSIHIKILFASKSATI